MEGQVDDEPSDLKAFPGRASRSLKSVSVPQGPLKSERRLFQIHAAVASS